MAKSPGCCEHPLMSICVHHMCISHIAKKELFASLRTAYYSTYATTMLPCNVEPAN